jgi:hypothetical protein
MAGALPRGIRNCNPGNLDRFPPQPFKGVAAEQPDPEFYTFADSDGVSGHVWGIRAMAIVLLAYQDKHNLNTLRLICGRYANRPGVDNPAAYAGTVAAGMRVGRDDPLNLQRSDVLAKVLAGMIKVECAGYAYPPVTISQAITMAYAADDIVDVDAKPTAPAVADTPHENVPTPQIAAVQDTSAGQEGDAPATAQLT